MDAAKLKGKGRPLLANFERLVVEYPARLQLLELAERLERQAKEFDGRKHETRPVRALVFGPPLPDPKRRGAAAHV